MMTIIKKMNNLSTTLESIFLLMLRPLMPPRMPPMTMRAKSHIVNSGTVLVTRELIRLVIDVYKRQHPPLYHKFPSPF